VADFLLVDVDGPTEGRGSSCLEVSRGGVRGALLQTSLATRPAVLGVHVVCLSQVDEAFDTVGRARASDIVGQVSNALPSVEMTRVHVVGVAQPTCWPRVDAVEVGWIGWHNVLLAPENSRGGPRAGVDAVWASPFSSVRVTQQAAALCSAVGL